MSKTGRRVPLAGLVAILALSSCGSSGHSKRAAACAAFQKNYSVQFRLSLMDPALFARLASYPAGATALTKDPAGVSRGLTLATSMVEAEKVTDPNLDSGVKLLVSLSTPGVRSAIAACFTEQ